MPRSQTKCTPTHYIINLSLSLSLRTHTLTVGVSITRLTRTPTPSAHHVSVILIAFLLLIAPCNQFLATLSPGLHSQPAWERPEGGTVGTVTLPSEWKRPTYTAVSLSLSGANRTCYLIQTRCRQLNSAVVRSTCMHAHCTLSAPTSDRYGYCCHVGISNWPRQRTLLEKSPTASEQRNVTFAFFFFLSLSLNIDIIQLPAFSRGMDKNSWSCAR